MLHNIGVSCHVVSGRIESGLFTNGCDVYLKAVPPDNQSKNCKDMIEKSLMCIAYLRYL